MTDPLIGYRHNPCRTCGRQVTTPGCTLCLDCVCKAADAAQLRMPDLAKLMIERLAQVDEAEIAADLRELTPNECVDSKRRTERNPNGIRHSSEDDHSTAIFPGDSFALRRRLLEMHGRKVGL